MIFELFCSYGTLHLTRKIYAEGSTEIKKAAEKYKSSLTFIQSRRGYLQGFTMKLPNGLEIRGSRDWESEQDGDFVVLTKKYKISRFLSEMVVAD